MRKSGQIAIFRKGCSAIIPIADPLSLAALQTFAALIQPYTLGGLEKICYTEAEILDTPESTNTQTYDGIIYEARIFLKQEPEEANIYPYNQINIKAPSSDIFQYNAKLKIWEVKQEVGEIVAEGYSVLCGKTHIFKHGALAGK